MTVVYTCFPSGGCTVALPVAAPSPWRSRPGLLNDNTQPRLATCTPCMCTCAYYYLHMRSSHNSQHPAARCPGPCRATGSTLMATGRHLHHARPAGTARGRPQGIRTQAVLQVAGGGREAIPGLAGAQFPAMPQGPDPALPCAPGPGAGSGFGCAAQCAHSHSESHWQLQLVSITINYKRLELKHHYA